jgi:transcriptional regulator with XRE-family HTH domain
MSQKELADKIGIKQPTLSELETGESAGTTYLARIASALAFNALWLETGRGPREHEPESVQESSGLLGALEVKAESAAELRLLSIYRLANMREREAIDDTVEQMRRLIETRARAGDAGRAG